MRPDLQGPILHLSSPPSSLTSKRATNRICFHREPESGILCPSKRPGAPESIIYVQKCTGRGNNGDLTLPCSSSDISRVCSTRNELQGLFLPERELPRRRRKPYLQLVAIIPT